MSKRQDRAHASGRQGGENRQRMDQAFVEHSQHDVDRRHRRRNQHRFAGERGLEGLSGALKAGMNGAGHADLRLRLFERGNRLTEGDAGREVEGERDGGKLRLVIHCESRAVRLIVRDRGERHLSARVDLT